MKKNASNLKLDNFKNYSFKSLNVIIGGNDTDDGDIEKKKLKRPTNANTGVDAN